MYRTCQGCRLHGQPCEARDAVKARVKGIGITSIKWKCVARIPIYKRGDAVWALTVWGGDAYSEDDGEPSRDYFPGVVLKVVGTKVHLFIEEGVAGRGDFGDGSTFTAKNARGFCRIPLSRVSKRDADPVTLCKYCDWPESKGHQPGFSCNPGEF